MRARFPLTIVAVAVAVLAGTACTGGKGGGGIGLGGYGLDDATQISSGSQSAQNPAFRDDGTLAYTRFLGGYGRGAADVRTLRLSPLADTAATNDGDTEGVRNVSSAAAIFRTDGNLVYSSNRGADRSHLWITGGVLIGGDPVEGTTADEDQGLAPTLSPDGEAIAFERVPAGDASVHEIFRIAAANATPGSAVRLTGPGGDDRNPDWSPLGNKILFQSRRDGNWEIYTMNTDGSGVLNVTSSPDTEDTDGSWSPDGQWIVYSTDRRDPQSEGGWKNVWAIPSAGGTPVRVTLADAYDGAPAWSPDGTRIAFESNRRANERTNLFLINVPGGIQ